jgi:hypothetical protein
MPSHATEGDDDEDGVGGSAECKSAASPKLPKLKPLPEAEDGVGGKEDNEGLLLLLAEADRLSAREVVTAAASAVSSGTSPSVAMLAAQWWSRFNAPSAISVYGPLTKANKQLTKWVKSKTSKLKWL